MLTINDNKQSQDDNFCLLHKTGLEKKIVFHLIHACIAKQSHTLNNDEILI